MTTEQPTPDLPTEAVEAAAKAINAVETPNGVWELEDLEDILFRRDQARAALAAAWPLLRAQVADEIRGWRMPSPKTDHAIGWNGALEHAAGRVARGGTDA